MIFLRSLILLSFLQCSMAFAAPIDGAPLSPPLPANLWIELSKITQPGVVGIYIERDRRSKEAFKDPMLQFLEEFLGPGFEFEAPSGEEQSSPIGTGFIIKKEGLIVTNYHVVEPADHPRFKASLKVKVYGQEKLIPAEIIGKDPRGDLAVLKLKEAKDLKPLVFGDSDKLSVGEYVAAFGNPYGHSNSMTVGIISAKGRAIKELNRFPFLQTDASINPGNSGGPLLDTRGYVIGVNTAIDARAQGIGFAIPANYVKKIVSIIEKGESIRRGFLGIGLMTISAPTARDYGIKKPGVAVTDVQQDSPADKAGIKIYDVIVEFNKQPIRNSEELRSHVLDTEVGKSVELKVLRSKNDGPFKEKTLTVSIGAFPEKNKKKNQERNNFYLGQKAPYDFGFHIVDGSSGARRNFNLPPQSPFGPIVSEVDFSGTAAQAGLKEGDIILEVNRKEASDSQKAISLLKKGMNKLLVFRQGVSTMILLKTE